MADAPIEDCPDDDVLVAFARGEFSDDDLARIAAHLERCAACTKVVAQPDAFVQNLQRIHQDGATPSATVSMKAEDAAGPYFFNVDKSTPTDDPERFFDALAKSGLFDAEDVKAVRREWKAYRSTDFAAFTQALALEGRLTEFHVRQLLRGKTRGWVLNDYVVLHPLGAGGMDWMYRARHRRSSRTFAIKITPPHLARTTSATKRFQREIEAIAKLRHPRLVTAVGAGEADGVNYLVMEETAGHSLAEWVELNGPMRVLTAVDMIRQAAEGIAAAHDAGVIHRNLNPSVLWMEVFTGSGRLSASGPGIKVLDFGLARMTGETSQVMTGANQPLAGTPGYAAPEQVRDSRTADARSDVYSLGCTLYFLLTGKAPYTELVPKDGAPIPPLESPREAVPAALQTIYRRMVARSPRDRYRSVDDLILDLDAFLAGSTLRAPWPRWLTTIAILGAAAVVLIGVLLLLLPSSSREPAASRSDGVVKVSGPLPAGLEGPVSTEAAMATQKTWAAALGVPVDLVNRQKMKLRLIPPGTMELGTPTGQVDERLVQLVPASREWQWLREFGRGEQPQRRVTIAEPFYLGTTEVTVAQFRAFVDATKYQTKAEADGLGGVRSMPDSARQSPALTWRTPGYSTQTDAHPVVQVEYADAEAYCRWLSEFDGRPYVLPTEDEWEYACRAGQAARWFWGDDGDGHRGYVAAPGSEFEPSVVASRKANAFGLFDTSGNVAEWCVGGVARGGGFVNPLPDGVASASRIEPRDPRQDFVGFRVVAKIKIEKK